ncbi:MAG: 2-C-methyl-D-erythritol 2,4-cyclodiphosphate synthase, partial [Armatimonadota bacterium]
MAGFTTAIVDGETRNFKVTLPEDLLRAQTIAGHSESRTGLGYDIHRFSADPACGLYLGGIFFENEAGLEGHSDADVVLHAATDALLGAAALGDIGVHFPNSDPRWKDLRSEHFLRYAVALVRDHGWRLANLDIAVLAETPRIMRRAALMREEIARALTVEIERIGLKATTNEGLGAIGRSEGIAAFATATIV